MRNLRVFVPVVVAAVAIAVVSFSIALAAEKPKAGSDPSKLATKVAEILGLDVATVDDALKRSIKELRDEAVQKKLDILVEKGRLTRGEANERLNSIQSKAHGVHGIGKQFLGPKGHLRDWKDQGAHSWESMGRKLRVAVKNGDMTREEVAHKLQSLRLEKAAKDDSR